jgi:hypothetical protein
MYRWRFIHRMSMGARLESACERELAAASPASNVERVPLRCHPASIHSMAVGDSMRQRTFVIAMCAIGVGVRLEAQNPVQPIFAHCSAPTDVFTELQVQRAARLVADSLRSPRPTAARSDSPNVITFIVDTLGVPERSSLSRVRTSDSALVERAASGFVRWRFSPAVASGCRVRQRVVVAVQP